MPALSKSAATQLIWRRHPEWIENEKRWRMLADSLEGGNRYRHADYAVDPTRSIVGNTRASLFVGTGPPYGQLIGQSQPFGTATVDRNLIPHNSERDVEGFDLYLTRLNRTPVPKIMERVIRRHLSRIYAREVQRTGSVGLTKWWEDVNGLGVPIDKWMRKVIAPLLCCYGQLDVSFDRPSSDTPILTRQDELSAGLDSCVASYILPENMVWWRLDAQKRFYAECLVLERDDQGCLHWRHWDDKGSTLYEGEEGQLGEVVNFTPHDFGRPPIVRLFDERKLRCTNVGQPRYESIAELQRAIYNGQSELILGDVLHAHPILQVAEKLLDDDSKVLLGPGRIMPILDSSDGQPVLAAWLENTGSGADAQRQHIQDYTDQADRDAALMKPAGATTAGTTAQSGLSKSFDSQEGNDYLAEVSETLGDAERSIAEMVMVVLAGGPPNPADVELLSISYPKEFDLFTADDIAAGLASLQQLMGSAGLLPTVEAEALKRLVRALFPGIDDDTMNAMNKEIEAAMVKATSDKEMYAEAGRLGAQARIDGTVADEDEVVIGQSPYPA